MTVSRIPPLAVVLILLAGPIALASPLAEASDAPRAYVNGFVYDEAGKPLADIVVEGRSYAPGTGHEVYARNVTNAKGAFSLTLGEGKTIISANNEKTGRSTEQGIYLERDQTSEIKLVIESPPAKDAIVTGVVRGLDGKPIGGARVTISSGGCCYAMAIAESAPKGDDGAANPPPATQPSADSTSSSPAPPGDSDEPRQTEARIAPIRCCYDNGYAETVTDKEGRYRLETYNGTHQLTATANHHAQTTVSVVLTSGKTVEKDLELEKVPGETSTLEGRVVDAKTGAPMSGAWVYLTNLEWSRYANAQTGRDGKFSLTTIPGWVQISIQPPCCDNPEVELDAGLARSAASPEYRSYLKAFSLADGKSTQEFQLVPKAPATIVLTGYVVDPTTKKAVPDAWVNIWNQDSGDWGGARTDAAGSYKLLVRAGAHQITAYAEGYLNGADTILVESSDTVKRVDIQMPRGTSKYASCEECYHNIAYDTATPVPAGAPGEKTSPDSASQSRGGSEMATRSETADSGGSRATTYEGTGGGLPPYDPDNTGTIAAAEHAATIPQLGLIGVLLAGALVALAIRRRN